MTCTAGSILATTMYARDLRRKAYVDIIVTIFIIFLPFRVSCFTMIAFIWFIRLNDTTIVAIMQHAMSMTCFGIDLPDFGHGYSCASALKSGNSDFGHELGRLERYER